MYNLYPVKQTRLHKGLQPISDRGNCFPACIASLLNMQVEDVIQIQEHYDNPEWPQILQRWLNSKGYRWRSIEQGEDVRGKYILVSGTSPRFSNCTHIVIYKDGVMVHDPHPDNGKRLCVSAVIEKLMLKI